MRIRLLVQVFLRKGEKDRAVQRPCAPFHHPLRRRDIRSPPPLCPPRSHKKVDITDTSEEISVTFSYSVEWINEINLKHSNRMSRYVDSAFLPNSLEIHWLR